MKKQIVKQMKYIILVILTAMLLEGTVLADEGIIFHVENQSGKAGDRIQVPLSLEGTGSIGGFDLSVKYDGEALELQSVEQGELIKDSGLFDYNDKKEESTIKIIYVSPDEIEMNGKVVMLNFLLKKDCPDSLPVGIKIDDMIDASEEGNTIGGGAVTGVNEEFQEKIGGTSLQQKEEIEADSEEQPEITKDKEVKEEKNSDSNNKKEAKKERKENLLIPIAVGAAGILIIVFIIWQICKKMNKRR